MSEEKKHEKMMARQRKIDDASVALILQALDNGIALPNDPVYKEMLEQYPHYQVKLEGRNKKIKEIKDKIEGKIPHSQQQPKYKFEHLKGRRNLSNKFEGVIVDVQTVKPEDDMEL